MSITDPDSKPEPDQEPFRSPDVKQRIALLRETFSPSPAKPVVGDEAVTKAARKLRERLIRLRRKSQQETTPKPEPAEEAKTPDVVDTGMPDSASKPETGESALERLLGIGAHSSAVGTEALPTPRRVQALTEAYEADIKTSVMEPRQKQRAGDLQKRRKPGSFYRRQSRQLLEAGAGEELVENIVQEEQEMEGQMQQEELALGQRLDDVEARAMAAAKAQFEAAYMAVRLRSQARTHSDHLASEYEQDIASVRTDLDDKRAVQSAALASRLEERRSAMRLKQEALLAEAGVEPAALVLAEGADGDEDQNAAQNADQNDEQVKEESAMQRSVSVRTDASVRTDIDEEHLYAEPSWTSLSTVSDVHDEVRDEVPRGGDDLEVEGLEDGGSDEETERLLAKYAGVENRR